MYFGVVDVSGNSRLHKGMKLPHGRPQVINGNAGRLHNKIGDPRDFKCAGAGSCRTVDYQQVVLVGNLQSLGCGGEGFCRDFGFNACIEPGSVPVD